MTADQLSGATPTDVELMQRIEVQDQDALMLLYGRYGSYAYSLALRILRDPGLAEEATQDAFLKIWHKSAFWDEQKGHLSSWLLTITRYAAIDRLRKEQRHTGRAAQLLDTLDDPATSSSPGGRLWLDGQLLRELIAQLPQEQAQVIELAFFQGYTHSELAGLLDWPLGTVKTRLRLGLQKLRSLWREASPRE